MGKRITRIFPEDFAKQFTVLQEKHTLDIILKSGAVHHCKLEKKEGDTLFIKDFLFNKHILAITDIQEIQYDSESKY